MANEAEDILTERHSHIIAHEYGIAPSTTKCERTIRTETDWHTLWLARKDRTVRCMVGYHGDYVRAKQFEGDPCTCCWSADKQWEDETVPKYVFCTLSGFEPPVEWLNTVFEPGEPVKEGVYLLEQQNAPDCTYEYLSDTVEIIWTPDDVTSTIIVKTHPDNIVRMDASAGGCFRRFQQNHCRAEIKCC